MKFIKSAFSGRIRILRQRSALCLTCFVGAQRVQLASQLRTGKVCVQNFQRQTPNEFPQSLIGQPNGPETLWQRVVSSVKNLKSLALSSRRANQKGGPRLLDYVKKRVKSFWLEMIFDKSCQKLLLFSPNTQANRLVFNCVGNPQFESFWKPLSVAQMLGWSIILAQTLLAVFHDRVKLSMAQTLGVLGVQVKPIWKRSQSGVGVQSWLSGRG